MNTTVISDGIFVFSPASLWEVSQDDCFDDFISVLSTLPSLLVLSDDEIIDKEIQHYDSKEPISIKDISLLLSGKSAHDLKVFIENYISKISSQNYKTNEQNAFNKIKCKDSVGYLDGQTISAKKVTKSSVELVAFEFVAKAAPTFCNKLQENNSVLDISKFPSQLSKSYIYHYKFAYPNRKGEASDLSDILISSALPYVDVYLTENSVANSIREIKDSHGQFKHLQTKIMRQMRTKEA